MDMPSHRPRRTLMPYTSHGHAYGLINADEPKPRTVVRCGGPYMCPECAREAALGPSVNNEFRHAYWEPVGLYNE